MLLARYYIVELATLYANELRGISPKNYILCIDMLYIGIRLVHTVYVSEIWLSLLTLSVNSESYNAPAEAFKTSNAAYTSNIQSWSIILVSSGS